MSLAVDRAEEAATWAARLADGELPLGRQDEFQDWLDADPLNALALDEIVGAWRAVEYYAASEQMVALRQSALASARRATPAPTAPETRTWILRGLLAATLALVIGGGLVWGWLAPRTYETGIGERRVVVLTDGSKLSLDGATTVKVRYAGGNRRLWLDHGRAKFDVAKDSLRPFSVTAGNKVVVATGTAFSVERVQDEIRVVLYEGHVALLQRSGSRFAEPVAIAGQPAERFLTPGRELVLPEEPVEAVVRKARFVAPKVADVDPVRSLSWEGGQLVFEDEPLGVVAERMNRYSNKELSVADPATAAVRISGVFRAGDTDALVQGLAAAFNIESRIGADSVVLARPKTTSAD